MSARDVALFLIVAIFSIRWLPVAAAMGPSALVLWIGGVALLFVPLVICVLELSRRYPEEGGLYSWVKRAFGQFPGFITGWTYWASNLPYFPALLYFAAGNALYILPGNERLATSGPYFVVASLAALAIATVPNVLGISKGKWVQNLGAMSVWIPAMLVIAFGTIALAKYGSATAITAESLVPAITMDTALAWTTIAFAVAGAETVSLIATQVKDPGRTIPRAVVTAGTIVVLLYVLGTAALLWALPAGSIGRIEGIVQAIDAVALRLGLEPPGRVVALLVVAGTVGGVGAWLTATARLPYVAGLDRYLPRRFGEVHPRFGTPFLAMLTQAGIAAVLIVIGQAGATVRGAYDMLIAMSAISYFIPFLLMFAAAFRLAKMPHGGQALVSPRVLRLAAVAGFGTMTIATVLAFVPSAAEPQPLLATGKLAGLTILLLASGCLVYARGARAAGRRAEA